MVDVLVRFHLSTERAELSERVVSNRTVVVLASFRLSTTSVELSERVVSGRTIAVLTTLRLSLRFCKMLMTSAI